MQYWCEINLVEAKFVVQLVTIIGKTTKKMDELSELADVSRWR